MKKWLSFELKTDKRRIFWGFGSTGVRIFMLYALPIVVFFTNFPLIKIGSGDSMNFEISLPMIWLALFDLLSLTKIREIWTLFKKRKAVCSGGLAIVLWVFLSVLWSANPIRGLLTAGLVGAIYFAILSFFAEKPRKVVLRRICRILIGTSVFVSTFCIIQGFANVFEWGELLLCEGCLYQKFGFPHSNGFTIEPQFMGNLLIAPCILSLEILYYNIKSKKGKGENVFLGLLAFWQILALFITFSRGAIYSFMLAVILISVYGLIRVIKYKDFMRLVIYCSITGVAFLAGLFLQGIWAEISPTNEGFTTGIARSIDQLSLGKIKLEKKTEISTDTIKDNTDGAGEVTEEETLNKSDFNGYVEESTNVRLGLNEVALKTWSQNPKNMLLGVGIGGAGKAIRDFSSKNSGEIYNEKEIVQNEFFSILLELGVVGIVLVAVFAILCIKFRLKNLSKIFTAIILAYLCSMMFYSGITNVWHIYLLTPILALFWYRKSIC